MEPKTRRKTSLARAVWTVLGVVLIAAVWATFLDTFDLLSTVPSISRYRYVILLSLTYLLALRIYDEWTDR